MRPRSFFNSQNIQREVDFGGGEEGGGVAPMTGALRDFLGLWQSADLIFFFFHKGRLSARAD